MSKDHANSIAVKLGQSILNDDMLCAMDAPIKRKK